MADFWPIFYGFILGILINLISNWVWGKIFNRPLNKFMMISLFSLSILFMLLSAYPQESALPTGIDKDSTNLQAAWNNKGYLLFKEENYDEAIRCYDEAIKIDPSYTIAWSNKGIALKELGRFAEAQAAFDNARKAKG